MTVGKGPDYGALTPWAPGQPLTAPESHASHVLELAPFGQDFAGVPGNVAWIAQGRRAQSAGIWHVAEGAFGMALRIALQHRGASSDEVLDSVTNLAAVQRERGNMASAKELQTEVLKRRRRRRGARHPSSLAAERDLAETQAAMGMFDEARRHQEHVLTCRMTSADDDLATAAAMSSLGATLLYIGDVTEASRLLGEALDIYRRKHGPDHPDTLRAEDSVGVVHWVRGEFSAARKLQGHVLASLPREGISQHDTLVFKNNLAATLTLQGDLAAAREIQEHVLEACTQYFGSQHPITIGYRANLAGTARAQGDLHTARRLCEEDLDSARRRLGTGHLNVFAIEGVLAETLRDLGDDESLRRLALQGLAALPAASASARKVFERYAFLLGILTAQATGDQTLDWLPSLLNSLPTTSSAFRDALELRPVQERGDALAHYVDFHRNWVTLCAAWAPHRLPQAIAPLHGLESWSAVLLRLQGAEFASRGAAHAALSRAKGELRQLRIRQAELASMIDGALGHIANLETLLRRSANSDGGDRSLSPDVNEVVVMGLRLELESHLAQRAKLVEQESVALNQYRKARAEVARIDPTLAALTVTPGLTSHDLADRLRPGEAMLVTITLADRRVAVLVVQPGTLNVVAVDELPSLTVLAQRYQIHHRTLTRGAGLRDGAMFAADAPSADSGGSEAGDGISTARLQQAVRHVFWSPLASVLGDAQRVHLITGPGHHSLPLECGAPSGLHVHRYFGLPAYLSVRDRPLPLPPLPSSVDIVVDAAWSSMPIPFVDAEADLVCELLSPSTLVRKVAGRRVLQGRTHATQLLMCLHGGRSGQVGKEHGFLIFDSGGQQPLKLDPPKVAALSSNIAEVYASACLGALVGSSESGSALGLCSEWQLRGVTAMVACLGPVEDHFMPLLTAMFWLQRLNGHAPYDALQGAKEQLLHGDWPGPILDPLRRTYLRTMRRVLQRARWRDADSNPATCKAASSVSGWLLPPYVRASYFDDDFTDSIHREFSSAYCERPKARERLISQCLAYLIDERAQPEDAAVRPFAQAAIANICAMTHCFGSGGVTGLTIGLQ